MSDERTEGDESLAARIEQWMMGQMPIIQMHGGSSVVREANEETGVVVVELGGTCSGCGISNVTAENIRRDLILDFEEVSEVHVKVPSSGDQGASTVEGGRGGELPHETEPAGHF